MREWKNTQLSPRVSILNALKIIDDSALQIGLVVDEQDHLLGTVTDGDVRRGILKGIDLNQPITDVMNRNPATVMSSDSKDNVLRIMRERLLRQLPVLDKDRRVVGMVHIDDLFYVSRNDNWIVLMAGGLGSRLGELTQNCPKPLIPVGGKPLLETIIESFKEHGFYKFFISVNYKANMIEEYFRDGHKWGVDISYLRETERRGTAGALNLLQGTPQQPVIVMNGDLLTKINFQQLLDFHMQQHSFATMCVREYSFQVPYGVVRVENEQLHSIDEKPTHSFFVNAGVYVLSPEAIKLIPDKTYFDMTDLFDLILNRGEKVSVFPIREYWLDIGRRTDLERANGEFGEVFG